MGIFKLLNQALINNLSQIGIEECSSHYIFHKNIEPHSLVMDIGANKGSFFSTIQNRFDCHCITIEASPDLFAVLPISPNVKHYNYAICAEDRKIEFTISNNPEASSLHQEIASSWGISKKVMVDGLKFETFKKKYDIPDQLAILKIDIEGAELDLLENISSKSLTGIAQIAVEFHDFIYDDKVYLQRMKSVINKLKHNSFEVIKISNSDWRETLFINTKIIKLGFMNQFRIRFFHRNIQAIKHLHSTLSLKLKNASKS